MTATSHPNVVCPLDSVHGEAGQYQKSIGELRIYQCAECQTVFDNYNRIRQSIDKS